MPVSAGKVNEFLEKIPNIVVVTDLSKELTIRSNLRIGKW
jgi:hypothetical protein